MFFFLFFCFCFFCTYEHVVGEHLPRAHYINAQHSTAQHSTAHKPRTKQQSKNVSTRPRQRKQRKPTDKKMPRARPVVERLSTHTARCVHNIIRTQTSKSARPPNKHHKKKTHSKERSAFSRLSLQKRGPVSVRLTGIFLFFLVSERSGRRKKPPAGRNALYTWYLVCHYTNAAILSCLHINRVTRSRALQPGLAPLAGGVGRVPQPAEDRVSRLAESWPSRADHCPNPKDTDCGRMVS